MYELVASGGIIDAWELENADNLIAERQRGFLRLDLRSPLSGDILNTLNQELRARGVEEGRAEQNGQTVNIYFRKGFPWLAVIAAILLGIIILAILIIGWNLFKEVVPPELRPLIGTGIIILSALVGYGVLIRRKS
jgi:hypothetical protein